MDRVSVSITELNSTLSQCLNRAAFGRERIIVTSRGKPKAALISIEDLRRLEELEELEDALSAWEALDAHRRGETVPWEEVKERLLAEAE